MKKFKNYLKKSLKQWLEEVKWKQRKVQKSCSPHLLKDFFGRVHWIKYIHTSGHGKLALGNQESCDLTFWGYTDGPAREFKCLHWWGWGGSGKMPTKMPNMNVFQWCMNFSWFFNSSIYKCPQPRSVWVSDKEATVGTEGWREDVLPLYF